MTQDQAKDAYRQAWMGWCFSQDLERKQVFELRMDFYQPYITRGPGVEWQAFAETLPGFIEFWETSVEGYVENIVKIVR